MSADVREELQLAAQGAQVLSEHVSVLQLDFVLFVRGCKETPFSNLVRSKADGLPDSSRLLY